MVGAGVRSRPAYDGSDSRVVEAVPVLRYYGSPWFVRSTRGVLEAGARMNLGPGLILGAQVAHEQGRNSDDSDFLKSRNVAGVNPGASLGAHLELNQKFGPVPVNVIARVRQHADSDRGLQADLRITAGIFAKGPVAAGVFIQPTWANSKSTSSFYGITPREAAATGLPAYEPGGGMLTTNVGLIYSIDLVEHWVIVGNLEARRVHGDAARSPITERNSAYYAVVGLAYRW